MPYFEKGNYSARIIAAQLIESTNGTPQIELSLELIGIYHQDGSIEPVPAGRYPPRIFVSLTEKAMGTPQEPGFSARVLQQLGFDGDFGNMSQFEEWEGAVYNDHQAKNDGSGQLRDNWSIVLPRNAVTKAPEKKVSKALNKQFGSLFKKAATAAVTVPPAGDPATNGELPPPAADTPEDIPF